ncbi:MAG TPA: DUF1003 domain-containing protein [Candidatus Binatia bacterium]|nr:DUF1003 domain-containing protein [Candidatus Binatia bacterium]
MAQHADEQCFHCKRIRPYDVMVPGEMLRPALIETIRKHDATWGPSRMICVDCLDLFRSEYVEDALKDEVGELSKLEQEVIDSLREQETLTENINRAFEKSITFGQRVADRVATFGGSWIFIGTFFLLLAAWIGANSVATLLGPFDPYPYILLNLMLSCLAAMQAPIIMMSQNRIEARDRLRSENDYQVNLKAELEIRQLHEKLDVLLKHQWQKLLEIQQIQMDFMRELMRRIPDSRNI